MAVDWKWLVSTLFMCLTLCATAAMGGALLWRNHLRAVADDWKQLAEARLARINDLAVEFEALKAQTATIISENVELTKTVNGLLSRLAEYEVLFQQQGLHLGARRSRRIPTSKD